MSINNLKDAITEFYFYQKGTAGGFQTMLFDLMAKADSSNFARLAIAFPLQAEAYQKWMLAADYSNALFKEYGLPE